MIKYKIKKWNKIKGTYWDDNKLAQWVLVGEREREKEKEQRRSRGLFVHDPRQRKILKRLL